MKSEVFSLKENKKTYTEAASLIFFGWSANTSSLVTVLNAWELSVYFFPSVDIMEISQSLTAW